MSSPLSNALISLRESALRLAFNIPADEVLNPQPFQGQAPASLVLTEMLKNAVNEFKAEAMDESGQHVNYSKLMQTECYRRYTQELVPQLQTIDFKDLQDRQTSTTFWINLYNALVIHAVIAYNVQKSIAAGGFPAQVRFFRRAAYNVGGMRFSLEAIEHGVLRANKGNPFQFSPHFAPGDIRMACVIEPLDPRIHFALNCASVSCPPIVVYSPEKLDAQLDLASASYISQETRLMEGEMYISKLFSWYQKDFGGAQGVAAFLRKYLPDDARKEWLEMQKSTPKFKYLPYDWGLNI